MICLNKSKKAQTLLVVVIVTSLALLIVLGISDRMMLSQYNIQRDFEFDKAIVVAENRINEIKGVLSKRGDFAVNQCLNAIENNQQTLNYVDLLNINACQFLKGRLVDFERKNLNIFARRLNNSSLIVNVGSTLTLKFTDLLNQGVPSSRVRVSCSVNMPVIVTRAFVNPQGHMLIDKGFLSNCNVNMIDIPFYSSNGQLLDQNTIRNNTIYINVRSLAGQGSIRVEVYNQENRLVSSSDKYEFIVTGVGGGLGELGVGSDIPIKFELGAGRTYISNEFLDYAFFERN